MVHALRNTMSATLFKVLVFLAAAITIIQVFNIMYGRVHVLSTSRFPPTQSVQPAVTEDDSVNEKKFIKPEVELKKIESAYHDKDVSKDLVAPELATQ